MNIVTDRNYGQLLTVAAARRSRTIQDIVHNATPMTRILKDSGRIRTKRGGGPELRLPVQFDKLTAQWFTGYDKIEITPRELLNSAVFNWSRVVAPFSLNGSEILFTGGEEEIIDLVAFYLDEAERSVKETWEVGLFSDGTGDGGRQMAGFGAAIPIVANTGIYGGIDRSTVANWRTSTFNIVSGDVSGFTAWDSTTARPIINRISLNRSRNGRYADLLVADALAYEAVDASFVAHQRIVGERAGRLGFTSLTYMTPAGPVDIVAAGGIGNVMPANMVFGFDTDGLAIYEFPNQSFVPFHPGNGIRPINQDAIAQGIVWSGQLVLENPLFTYRIRTTS
ncbi:MAG: phage major capsid protein [Sphingobium sp.]|nr:phage major capsid protein [Sphingobium sp.]